MTTVAPGLYGHFKGNQYRVIGTGRHKKPPEGSDIVSGNSAC